MKLRQNSIDQMQQNGFDVLIVGGGINGAVCATALSAQGASVALIERGDFASCTSQESSNLIWGGIKYLQGLEFGLVRRLCKSRNHLMKAFPSNVKEIRFVTAIEKEFPYHSFIVFISTILYWAIGNFFTRAPRYLKLAKLKKVEPALNMSISNGGFEYSDAWLVDNDARFVFKFIRSALDHDATAVNYVEALGSTRRKSKTWLTQARDKVSGKNFSIRSKILINACGPYVDKYNRLSGQETCYKHLFSKGIHLIVPTISSRRHVLTFFADDARLFFVIPMDNKSCIGTTDTRIEKPLALVTPADRRFVLENVNKRLNLPRPLEIKDIIAERCGVRPLVIEKNGDTKKDTGEWTSLSRKHVIEVDSGKYHISIYGGKLTDCLNIGAEISQAVRKLKLSLPYWGIRWYGEPSRQVKKEFFHQALLMNLDARTEAGASQPISRRLWRRYGIQGLRMLEDIRRDPTMAEVLIQGTEYLRAELHHAARCEVVVSLEDFLRRRSSIALIKRKEEIFNSSGLQEACRILFGSEAQKKMDEYFHSPAHRESSA